MEFLGGERTEVFTVRIEESEYYRLALELRKRD
jgi:hypothetical protein